MIATIAFAALVLIALAYVLSPLIVPEKTERRACAGCGRALRENDNYCVACGAGRGA